MVESEQRLTFRGARDCGDEAERNALMAEILKYNEEDLAATWAVFEWLRGKLLG